MKTIHDFLRAKEEGKKITMISTYDYWSARLCEKAEIDCILVGDSVGMVVNGLDTTLPVTVDEMIYHAKAVRRGAPDTFIVVDMPFLSYQVKKEDAVYNAGRIMKETGCNAVKIEGGEEVAEVIQKLVSVGIPVMGHLGLTPQSVHALGGYKVQGKTEEEQKRILRDAKILEQAGVFAVVLEAVPSKLAKEITEFLEVPTIGIGAGKETDGQVLVFHDMLGFFDRSPKFVKRYMEGGRLIKEALKNFKKEVQEGIFPGKEHTYD
ncbi:MAG TPA: 3-methyl-2-oxobutanoate hydroxymethyltransferase [Persephonella sp.]|uniref:3-methyl-2-oxobutanoate hydroxymethyltransferase n=1 Tax=Persephonella marina (strain DSM 14350 / EX-H1) TaxID=123214 RepID=C0QS02_PERMH|nr:MULTISPECIES: 3-methyl-2-oxobutanoate hydroxymethyltransferase [Persephonella]ACO04082.1 3-methyl-2-oxobutanoate hydroxymethyltransferase [Persephonella marina EX-H1]HCB69193.1 3-methyl-2-oxobutanoate hydroxymethyltransferase [Persephonella sp.]